jgi:hypothetical protein
VQAGYDKVSVGEKCVTSVIQIALKGVAQRVLMLTLEARGRAAAVSFYDTVSVL